MKNANDKYVEYARVIQMCKGTKFENEPWKCIKRYAFANHPMFGNTLDLEFAVAILEDEPLFVGDEVYWKHNGSEFDWNGGLITVDNWGTHITRTPPKRTFTLNGEELPCPNNTPNGLELRIIGFKDHACHFTAVDDLRKVEIAINKLFTAK